MRDTARLLFHPYMRGESEWHEVPATIVGDCAVHRYATLHSPGTLGFGKEWVVSHIPTGMAIKEPLPKRFYDRGRRVGMQRDIVAWIKAFQESAPAFFDAARINDRETMKTLVGEALRIGRSL